MSEKYMITELDEFSFITFSKIPDNIFNLKFQINKITYKFHDNYNGSHDISKLLNSLPDTIITDFNELSLSQKTISNLISNPSFDYNIISNSIKRFVLKLTGFNVIYCNILILEKL